MILIDHNAKDIGFQFVIPSTLIGQDAVEELQAYIKTDKNPIAKIYPTITVVGSKPAPEAAVFWLWFEGGTLLRVNIFCWLKFEAAQDKVDIICLSITPKRRPPGIATFFNPIDMAMALLSAVLDWPTRVKVAAGAARGIAYLHEDCHPRIIHRDIKSSNILLDHNFEALVSDFGLAKLALDSYTNVTTHVMGTFGYMAPEYATSGKLTDKSDVYSFGVVLLELITGRKPVDVSQPVGDESLVEWGIH